LQQRGAAGGLAFPLMSATVLSLLMHRTRTVKTLDFLNLLQHRCKKGPTGRCRTGGVQETRLLFKVQETHEGDEFRKLRSLQLTTVFWRVFHPAQTAQKCRFSGRFLHPLLEGRIYLYITLFLPAITHYF
jgi:hypothetical protein